MRAQATHCRKVLLFQCFLSLTEIFSEMRFRERGRICIEVFLDQPKLPVIGMPGAIGVMPEREQVGKTSHGGGKDGSNQPD